MIIEKAGMAWIGKIINTAPIPNADLIVRTDIVCGKGGRWGAVIRKADIEDFGVDGLYVVFLPDAIVPPVGILDFLQSQDWRVKPKKLRGCPSEVLAVPLAQTVSYFPQLQACGVGDDVTLRLAVKKYEKEDGISEGYTKGNFPSYIPKTDELNFQGVYPFRELLVSLPCYISTKYDGQSVTIFVKDGEVRACTRNRELKDPASISIEGSTKPVPVWNIVKRYGLDKKLPLFEEKYGPFALQGECVGPGVQKNPLKLTDHDIRLFDVWGIVEYQYYDLARLQRLANELEIPVVEYYKTIGTLWSDDELRAMSEGTYIESGQTREGIVIRPVDTLHDYRSRRVSFKVINNDYKSD